MLAEYKSPRGKMALKVNFIHSYINHFPENLETCSEEQGERIHYDRETLPMRNQETKVRKRKKVQKNMKEMKKRLN